MKKKKACFFVKVQDWEGLRRVEFYSQDLRILKELGFDIHIATTPQEIRVADLYFVWWWTWAFAPVVVAKVLRRPVVITGVFDTWAFDRRLVFHQQLMKFALRHATRNIFLSELEYKKVPGLFNVNQPCYCPLSVDTKTYCPNGHNREDLVVTVAWLQAGNAERKCVPEVIQAAKIVHERHPEIHFLIAGEKGTAYPNLEQMVKDLGVGSYIQFPGAISREKKIELMQQCKVYLSPSRFEGFGLAILEAMSCGAPVVTSPVGAVSEVVGDAALLVDGTRPESIAEAVSHLLKQADICRDLGLRARVRAEKLFAYDRRKCDLESILASVMQ